MPKVPCCIVLEKEIRDKAHELGFSISKVTENVLKVLIERVEKADYDKGFPKYVRKSKEAEEVF